MKVGQGYSYTVPSRLFIEGTRIPNLIGLDPRNLKISADKDYINIHKIDKFDPCDLENRSRSLIYNTIQALYKRDLHNKFG